ncbi:hypothetical protein TNCV_2797721 [Trichonephila clavipes]|nr:hypothetical protein TNCV_2797721 [Trichonephila clavipes]
MLQSSITRAYGPIRTACGGLQPKKPFPVSELVISKRSWSFTSKSIRDRTHRRLCSKASQNLTSHKTTDREVAGAIPKAISGFKVHRVKGTRTNIRISIPATPKQK